MIDIDKHSLYKEMEVDSVLSNVFNLYFKKFIVLFVSSFIAIFIMQFLFYQLGFLKIYEASLNDMDEMLRVYSKLVGKIAIVSVVSVVLYGILNAFLYTYLIKSDIDPEARIGDIIIESFRKYAIHMVFYLILTMLMIIGGMLVGVIAFIIGSIVALIYLGTVLLPGGAIIVAEEKNAIEAIGRTFSLTHKDFWSVLGSLVLFMLIMILVSIGIAAVSAIPFAIIFFDYWGEAGSFKEMFNAKLYNIGIWTVLINSVTSAVTYPLYVIISIVLYFKLLYVENENKPQVP